MATVTADDVRALAQARGETGEEHVLTLADDEVKVESASRTHGHKVIYTQSELLRQCGEEVTEAEAITLAAALTARIATS